MIFNDIYINSLEHEVHVKFDVICGKLNSFCHNIFTLKHLTVLTICKTEHCLRMQQKLLGFASCDYFYTLQKRLMLTLKTKLYLNQLHKMKDIKARGITEP